jgi:diadenosine tetraphosphatase ApaH/serine/threonine PP2A family protein phosphatase
MVGAGKATWLSCLPRIQILGPVALIHANPESTWRAPMPDANDTELDSVYRPLGQPIVVYVHIHRSYVRNVGGMIVANTGSVSLSYDGDRRASYLLLDDSEPSIRHVEYDVDAEVRALSESNLPHADWIAKILETGSYDAP